MNRFYYRKLGLLGLLILAPSFPARSAPPSGSHVSTMPAQGELCEASYDSLADEEPAPPADFHSALRRVQRDLLWWQIRGVPPPQLPFVLHHGAKTKGAIVLIHGISETPGGMRYLAEKYHAEGFNVITVLLEGHGTRPEALDQADLSAWRTQIDAALEQARSLGDRVLVGGYSFGGTLAIDAARRLGTQVNGVALHSPMLSPAEEIVTKLRARQEQANQKPDANIWTKDDVEPNGPAFDGFTYSRTTTASYLKMVDYVNQIHSENVGAPLEAPVYIVYSEADRITAPAGTDAFIQQQQIPVERVLKIPMGRHDDSVRLSKSKRFPEAQIGPFIRQMISSAPSSKSP